MPSPINNIPYPFVTPTKAGDYALSSPKPMKDMDPDFRRDDGLNKRIDYSGRII